MTIDEKLKKLKSKVLSEQINSANFDINYSYMGGRFSAFQQVYRWIVELEDEEVTE